MRGPSTPRGLSLCPRQSALRRRGGGCRGGGPFLPPGVLATGIARAPVVQTGQRCPAVKRECPAPATAQTQAVKPFVLDGLPAPRSPATRRGRVVGRAFGACCFAGKLRSPAPPTGK